MGLFDGFPKNKYAEDVDLNIQLSLVIVMLGGVYADNWESEKELLVVRQIMCKSPVFKDNNDKQDEIVIAQAGAYMKAHDDALSQACDFLPNYLRSTAFAMAGEIIFADSILDPGEVDYMEDLAEKLNVNKSKARAIIETFEVLYRDITNEK